MNKKEIIKKDNLDITYIVQIANFLRHLSISNLSSPSLPDEEKKLFLARTKLVKGAENFRMADQIHNGPIINFI